MVLAFGNFVVLAIAMLHVTANVQTFAFPMAKYLTVRYPFVKHKEFSPWNGALFSQKGRDQDDNNDDETVGKEGADDDWREFRAKLVMKEKQGAQQAEERKQIQESESLPQQWAYESGPVIETGSIVLSKPKPYFGYGLRQQYFHKSAILVLKHEENLFTRGIILNRPSDMMLSDITQGPEAEEWRVWFGGEVQGISSNDIEIVCLHSMSSDAVDKVSTLVMKGIKYTTFEQAKDLVKAGEASPADFWLFAGYCGWGGGQLLEELARDSWTMITTDSQTVLEELKKRNRNVDPRDAGLDTWEMLMALVGREDEVKGMSETFDDLMLKEWVRQKLYIGASDSAKPLSFTGGSLPSMSTAVDADVDRAVSMAGTAQMQPGNLLRASDLHSPFLLSDQDMHKCTVLVTSDNEQFTTGVFLNHPTSKVVDIPITLKGTNHTLPVPFIQKYGGKYEINGEGERPILWLHCNQQLRDAQIGVPFDPSGEGIWECTADEVAEAIGTGMARPQDFMAISGGCIWEKVGNGKAGGLRGEIWDGKFEPIPSKHTQEVWDTLLSQDLLSTTNIDRNIGISNAAWKVGGKEKNYDNSAGEETTVVFKSNVRVSALADDALRRWVATYVLSAPRLYGAELSGKE